MVQKKDSKELWKDLTGEQQRPFFNLKKENIEEGFQATLDSFHSWARFRKRVERVDNVLESVYGEGRGINTAILHGSDVSGLALSPSSLALMDSNDPERGSDMDVILLLEDGPEAEARVNLANSEMTFRNCDRDYREDCRFPRPEIETGVYTVSEFIQDLEQAKKQPENLEELEAEIGEIKDIDHFRSKVKDPGELESAENLEQLDQMLGSMDKNSFLAWNKVEVEMPYHTFGLDYVKRMRAFMTGHIVHDDYRGQEWVQQYQDAENLILDEDGNVREELEEAFYFFSPNYSERIEKLRENRRNGEVWMEINNSDDLEIPRRYEINDEGYAEDQVRPEELSPEELQEKAREISETDDLPGEQTRLSDYRLIRASAGKEVFEAANSP